VGEDGFGGVSYSEAYDFSFRVGFGEGLAAFGDFGKQVSGFDIPEAGVSGDHIFSLDGF
jgi:hypothetical protein